MTSTPAKARPGMSTARCPECGRTYRHDQPETPPSCGRIYCTALTEWTPEQWAGKAHLARARQAAGLHLTDLDRHATTNAKDR